MKIKHTIYAMLLGFTLVPLYLFGGFMIYENDKKVEEIVRENLAAVSGTQILDITNFCETQKEKLEILANLDMVHDFIHCRLEGENTEARDGKNYLTNMLVERKECNSFVESLSIIDRDFHIVASSDEYDYGEISDLQYAKEKYLRGDFCFSDVLERNTREGRKRVAAAYQGIFEDGELIGYVVEEIDLAYFDKNRTETNLWNGGTFYLLDGSGRMISAGTGEEERYDFVTSEEERRDFQKKWDEVDLEKNPTGEISYQVGDSEYITYYAFIPYTDWNIKMSVNLTQSLESKRAYKMLFFITAALASLLVIAINYFITKRLTRSLDNIAGTLKKVQDHQDYTLRVENCGSDEIGVLAGKVNALLDYIEQENIQEKERQRHLRRKAERDPLTGVRNKQAIEDGLQDLVQRAQERGTTAAVIFVDIDDFKKYNTLYGHQQGDQVLRFVASVLQEYSGGIVGRNGGDEFVFGADNFTDASEVEERIIKILEILNVGVLNIETGERMSVSCSIGVVVAQGQNLSYSSLVRMADEAMYEAKQEGKNTYRMIVKRAAAR